MPVTATFALEVRATRRHLQRPIDVCHPQAIGLTHIRFARCLERRLVKVCHRSSARVLVLAEVGSYGIVQADAEACSLSYHRVHVDVFALGWKAPPQAVVVT